MPLEYIDFNRSNTAAKIKAMGMIAPQSLVIANNGGTYILEEVLNYLPHKNEKNLPTFPTTMTGNSISLLQLQALSIAERNRLLRFDISLMDAINKKEAPTCPISLYFILGAISLPSGYSVEQFALAKYLDAQIEKVDPRNFIREKFIWDDPKGKETNFYFKDLLPNHSLRSFIVFYFKESIRRNNKFASLSKEEADLKLVKLSKKIVLENNLPPKIQLKKLLAIQEQRINIKKFDMPPQRPFLVSSKTMECENFADKIENLRKKLYAEKQVRDKIYIQEKKNTKKTYKNWALDVPATLVFVAMCMVALFFMGKKIFDDIKKNKVNVGISALIVLFALVIMLLIFMSLKYLVKNLHTDTQYCLRIRDRFKATQDDYLKLEAGHQQFDSFKFEIKEKLNELKIEGYDIALALLNKIQPNIQVANNPVTVFAQSNFTNISAKRNMNIENMNIEETLPLLIKQTIS